MAEKSSTSRRQDEMRLSDRDSRGPWIRRVFLGDISAILLLLLLVVLVPVLVTQAVIYKVRLDARRGQELQANLELARSVAAIFGAYVDDVRHQELSIGMQLTDSPAPSVAEMDQILSPNGNEYPSIRDFSWVGTDGRIIASSRPDTIGMDVRDRDYFQRIARGQESVVGDLVQSKIDGQPIFVIARSIRGGNNVSLGVVTAVVDTRRLGDVLMVDRGGQGAISIIDSRGWNVYHDPEVSLTWDRRNWLASIPLLATALNGKEASGTYISPLDGQGRMGGMAPIQPINWVAVADRPEAEVTASVLSDLIRSFAVLFVVGVVAFLVALRIGRTLTGPIDRLREYTLAVGRGELNHSIDVSGPRELEELADAFNRMAAEIRAHEDRLEDYIHTTSHDLRAPLAIIQGHAQILEAELPKTRETTADRRSVEAILRGVRRMSAMIQDLVDSARLDAGQLHLHLEPVDLRSFLLDLREHLVGMIGAQRVVLDALGDSPTVVVDLERLDRILMNLITNALKYADPDTLVLIKLTCQDGEAVIAVIDRGPGISPEEMSGLFQRYRRTQSAQGHPESLGLGLYITRRLVEALGGRIWAESKVGKGSTFKIALPVAEVPSVTPGN